VANFRDMWETKVPCKISRLPFATGMLIGACTLCGASENATYFSSCTLAKFACGVLH
jgi:hypothetical protein